MPSIIVVNRPPLTFEWTDDSEIDDSAVPSSSQSFADQAIGTATADRIVIVLVSARGGAGGSRTIDSVTIGGNAATLPVASASCPNPTAIAYLAVPTGTTATVVVTASGTLSSCVIGVATVKEYQSATPSANNESTPSTAASVSVDLDVLSGGVGLWCVAIGQTAPADTTWANATEQYDLNPNAALRGSGAATITGAGTISGQASWTGSLTNSMCALAWR